jgi:hypothetical protein
MRLKLLTDPGKVLVTGEELIKLCLHQASSKLFNERRGQSKGIKLSELLVRLHIGMRKDM